MNIKQALEKLARQAKGSFKTVHDRVVIVKRFDNYLKDNNIQIKHVEHIKTKHIEGYIQERQTLGISKRTLQNEMSAIRKTLTQAGRDKLAYSERLSNKSLNIHNASRKGNRPRDTRILNREQVKQAVDSAIEIANRNNGKLINKPNLKQAMGYWHSQTRALGLTGKISPHSLRYAFTQELMIYYQNEGYTEKEALALTSMDLGHGDGRGRYIKTVYGKTGEEDE